MKRTFSILVIDDDEDVITMLETILKPRGHQVAGYTSVYEYLARLNRDYLGRLPDAVLVDLVNFDMPGWQACRLIKGIPLLKNTKVVAMSAILESEDLEKMKIETDAFLRKPATAEKIEQVLEELFENDAT